MTIVELYTLFLPLINILGTICLVALVAAGILSALVWIIRKIWMFVLAAGAITFLVTLMGLVLGAA